METMPENLMIGVLVEEESYVHQQYTVKAHLSFVYIRCYRHLEWLSVYPAY